ncbi:MAG: hypothetical protein PWP46_1729 [Fusobacteriaceae bacterium]|jgi:hypothetical protein|nr:hypothetical protein [Fusobacteriaceae bacterium]
MNIIEKKYKNYGKCIFVDNHNVQLIIALEFGIRILAFSFINEENILGENIDITLLLNSNDEKLKNKIWRMIGGHRFWHSPEENPRTYIPDSCPIQYSVKNDILFITQDTEYFTNLQKKIEIKFISDSEIELNHILINKNAWEIETAIWAITIMDKNGTAYIPFSKRKEKFLSTKHIEIWPYTDLTDKRFSLHTDYFTLSQNENIKNPFKIGINNEEGLAIYTKNNLKFTKKFHHNLNAKYPDNGCSFEIYTNNQILELESLSPIQKIKPNEQINHIEIWKLDRI